VTAYALRWTKAATKELERLDRVLRGRILAAVGELATTPRPTGSKKLRGAEDLWRIRIGDWRVVYELRDRELLVLVVRVRPRGGAYDD
jgi:mRNA interferase RelE/StbE